MIFARACQPQTSALRNHATKKSNVSPFKKVAIIRGVDIYEPKYVKVLKEHRARVPFLTREKAAYAILRKKGLSINTIAGAFGRSTSVISRILRRVLQRERQVFARFRYVDLRKLPRRRREHVAARGRSILVKLLSQWESWICGEEDEPP